MLSSKLTTNQCSVSKFSIHYSAALNLNSSHYIEVSYIFEETYFNGAEHFNETNAVL